jgi:hypothetical protein
MNRNKIQNLIPNIISSYKNIINEKGRLPPIESKINEYQNKIKDIDYKISNKRSLIDQIYIPDKDLKLRKIENERNSKIHELDNQYEEKTVVNLKYVGGNHTYCTSCQKNCHEYCDCIGGFVNRCYVFSIFGSCDKCGHYKSSHTLHSSYKYVTETQKNKIYNYDKIQKERDKYWKKYNEIYDEYNRKVNEKNRRQSELNDLNSEKSQLISQKNSYINDKNRVNENIKLKINNLKSIILELINISQKIKNIALNQFHFDIENEYIETSIEYLLESGDNKEQIKKLKENEKMIKMLDEEKIKQINENDKMKQYYLDNLEEENYNLNEDNYNLIKYKLDNAINIQTKQMQNYNQKFFDLSKINSINTGYSIPDEQLSFMVDQIMNKKNQGSLIDNIIKDKKNNDEIKIQNDKIEGIDYDIEKKVNKILSEQRLKKFKK